MAGSIADQSRLETNGVEGVGKGCGPACGMQITHRTVPARGGGSGSSMSSGCVYTGAKQKYKPNVGNFPRFFQKGGKEIFAKGLLLLRGCPCTGPDAEVKRRAFKQKAQCKRDPLGSSIGPPGRRIDKEGSGAAKKRGDGRPHSGPRKSTAKVHNNKNGYTAELGLHKSKRRERASRGLPGPTR